MQPVVNEPLAGNGFALRDLVRVAHRDVVDPTAVDVERLAEILHAHSTALDVPTGISGAPGAVPLHQMPRFVQEPERKIVRVLLFTEHLDPASGAGLHAAQIEARQLAVV